MPLFINNKTIIVPFNNLITVRELIESVCKESALSVNESYVLKLNGQVLDANQSLQDLGIKDKSNLIFESFKINDEGNNSSVVPPSSSTVTVTTTTTTTTTSGSNSSSNKEVSPFDVSANKIKAISKKRIFKEYEHLVEEINSDSSLPYRVYLKENSLTLWNAVIKGPVESPYQDGLFVVSFQFPEDYPFRPMNIRFLTKIYHINIDDNNGSVCLEILKRNSSISVKLVLESILSLLSNPNTDESLDDNKLKLYKEDVKMFIKTARDWTKMYAANSLEELKKIHNFD